MKVEFLKSLGLDDETISKADSVFTLSTKDSIHRNDKNAVPLDCVLSNKQAVPVVRMLL